jgi:surface antigen
MPAPRISTLVAAASLALAAAAASAQNLGFMKDSVMSFMNREDTAMILKNNLQALELPDGHTTTWSNPKSGHSGTATATRSFQENGMACRQLAMTNQAGGQNGDGALVYCKTKDGWRLVR